MSLKFFSIYSSLCLAFICLLILLYHRKTLPVAFKWLSLFLINWIIVDIVANILANNKLTNLPLLHLYTFLEFIIVSLFYQIILKHKKLLGIQFKHFILLGALLIIANAIFLQDIYGHNSYAKTFTNLSVITFSLLFIQDLIKGKVLSPFKQSLSWINSGFLIYFMGIFIIFLISDYLFREEKKLLLSLWNVNIALNNILMAILLIGILKGVRIKNSALSKV